MKRPSVPVDAYLRLAPGLRLRWQAQQECHLLQLASGTVQLNPSAAAVLELCDGRHTLGDIVAALRARFPEVESLSDDILEFVDVAEQRGWIRRR